MCDFFNYMAYDLLKPLIMKGETHFPALLDVTKKAECVIQDSAGSQDLNETLATAMFDSLQTLWALQRLVDPALKSESVSASQIDCVDVLRFDSKERDTMSWRVAVMVNNEPTLSCKLREALRCQAALHRHQALLLEAFNDTREAGTAMECGTQAAHSKLRSYLDKMSEWEITLQKGSTTHLAAGIRRLLEQHARAISERPKEEVVEDIGGDDVPSISSLATMLATAVKVWPLDETLRVLYAQR